MDPYTKAHIAKGLSRVMVSSNGTMGAFTKAHLRRMNPMEKASMSGTMAVCMKDSGLTEVWQIAESSTGRMGDITSEVTTMIRRVDMVRCIGKVGKYTKDSGLRERCMVMGPYTNQMELGKKANGNAENIVVNFNLNAITLVMMLIVCLKQMPYSI